MKRDEIPALTTCKDPASSLLQGKYILNNFSSHTSVNTKWYDKTSIWLVQLLNNFTKFRLSFEKLETKNLPHWWQKVDPFYPF